MKKAIIYGTATALLIYAVSFVTFWTSCELIGIPRYQFGPLVIVFSAMIALVVGGIYGSGWGGENGES